MAEKLACPFCGHNDTQVKDSRPTEDNTAIRRRRSCTACGARFTTFERVQLREMTVLKAGGRREPLDREKLSQSMNIGWISEPPQTTNKPNGITPTNFLRKPGCPNYQVFIVRNAIYGNS